jgi:hypothetical protein
MAAKPVDCWQAELRPLRASALAQLGSRAPMVLLLPVAQLQLLVVLELWLVALPLQAVPVVLL